MRGSGKKTTWLTWTGIMPVRFGRGIRCNHSVTHSVSSSHASVHGDLCLVLLEMTGERRWSEKNSMGERDVRNVMVSWPEAT